MMIPETVRQAFARNDALTLEFRSRSTESLRASLESFRHSIFDIGAAGMDSEWSGPAWVSELMETPDSLVLMLDLGEPPTRVVDEILEALRRTFQRYSVSGPSVQLASKDGPLEELDRARNGVVLRVYPASGSHARGWPFDRTWITEALKWLGDGDRIACAVISVQFTLNSPAATSFMEQQLARVTTHDFRMGVGASSAKMHTASFFMNQIAPWEKLGASISLAFGGVEATLHDFVSAFSRLKQIGRRLAPHAEYAFIDILDNLRKSQELWHLAGWRREGGAPVEILDRARHTLVFDGFPWQILGPGHIERLEDPPASATPLLEDLFELQVGDPTDWLGEGANKLRNEARRILGPCLPRYNEALAIATGQS